MKQNIKKDTELKLTTFQRLVLDCLNFNRYLSIQELKNKPLYIKYLDLHINTLYVILDNLVKFGLTEKIKVGSLPELKTKYFKTQKVFRRIARK